MKLHELTVAEEAARCLLCYDAPCSKVCPAASEPASFIMSVRFGNSVGASRRAVQSNLFSGVCAAACPSDKYCAGACIRGKIDRPVDIRLLHGYVAQMAAKNGLLPEKSNTLAGTRVLILGGSLAGLSAAAELAVNGAAVTVCADSWLCGFDVELWDTTLESLRQLGVKFVDSVQPNTSDFDSVVAADKKSLAAFERTGTSKAAVLFTGELVPGPDDAAYSVKKGRDAARRVTLAVKGAAQ